MNCELSTCMVCLYACFGWSVVEQLWVVDVLSVSVFLQFRLQSRADAVGRHRAILVLSSVLALGLAVEMSVNQLLLI